MAVSLKALALTGTLLGGGIAIPLYLKNSSIGPAINTEVPKTPRPSSGVTSRSTRKAESVEKVSCNISLYSSANKDILEFVGGRGEKTELYNFVSCTNLVVQGSQDSYLGNRWQGLFPSDVLSKKLSYGGGVDFSIVATTNQEDDEIGNPITITTFTNPVTKEFVKGKWGIDDTTFKKKAIVIPLDGIRETPNKVYLFVDEKE